MDKLQKALSKLNDREQQLAKSILLKLYQQNFSALNIQKLKGYSNIFRVRKGKIRIIYRYNNGTIFILAIERRSEKTYKNFS